MEKKEMEIQVALNDAKADIDFFQGLKISMKINRKEAKTKQVGVYS